MEATKGKRAMEKLSSLFNRNFAVKIADCWELEKVAYKLRYQVYCMEHGYEDAGQFPDELEHDRYDAFSSHGLIYHRDQLNGTAGYAAGVVRLVVAGEQGHELPVDEYCGDLIQRLARRDYGLQRRNAAEISRFAVSKEFKRRMSESETVSGVDGDVCYVDEHGQLAPVRRLFPHIILGLFAAIVKMSAQQGVDHWYAIMEPALLRLLAKFGIRFRHLGPVIEHHGKRQPVVGIVDEVLAGIYSSRPDVWHLITEHGTVWPLKETSVPASLGCYDGQEIEVVYG